jgi:pilus assembly protein CpaE
VTRLATVIGAVDQRLPDLLAACGLKVTSMSEAEAAALIRPGSLSADIIVIDMRGRDRTPAALAALRQKHPRIPFVVVASRLDPTLLLEAMRAGASECLVEPLTEPEIQAAIGRVVTGLGVIAGAQIFAFLGAKGGVGTTTAAVNVATELARSAPGSTVLIDLHLACGDTAVFLGAEPRFSVKDAIENIDRLDVAFFRSLVVHTKSGVDLLASSDRVMTQPVNVKQIGQVVDVASRYYQYTVLDVPRSEPAVLESLESVKAIVVVANQELATVRSAARIAAMLRQRYGKERVRVVVSRYDQAAEILQDDIQRAVGGPIRDVIPNDYRVALQAMNTGRPLVLGNHSRLSASFVELARDLAGLDQADVTDQPSRSLFGRLTGRRKSSD